MRTSIAALGGITILFVGVFAIGTQAELVEGTAMNSSANGSSAAYNTSQTVFEGLTGAAGPGAAFGAAAAVVLVCVGIAFVAYGGAR